jgi:hypothetical protein
MGAKEILVKSVCIEFARFVNIGLTAATFPPTLKPCFLNVSLLSTALSVGNARIVPDVSCPIIAGKLSYLYNPWLKPDIKAQ